MLTFLRQPGLDATNGRAELAIRFGVILQKVWGGNPTWPGARAQAVLRSVWRTCWQQGRSALDCVSRLLRGRPVLLALPPAAAALRRTPETSRTPSSSAWHEGELLTLLRQRRVEDVYKRLGERPDVQTSNEVIYRCFEHFRKGAK
jgi:hypothetical protein